MSSKQKILVIAAHPDDEVLGCGGTIALHAQAGDEVHLLLFAEGITARQGKRDSSAKRGPLEKLRLAATKASKILGAKSLTMLGFPDNRMDSLDLLDIVKEAEKVIEKLRPDVVYTHHPIDVNVDHRVLHDAIVTACRPIPGHSVVKLLFFEVPSSTEWRPVPAGGTFTPNVFVDISATLDLKIKALEAYASEMRPYPHARSLKAVRSLAEWRGASAGVDAAECFVLGREIIRAFERK